MVLKLTKLELLDIDRMSRVELIDTIRTSEEHVPEDLVAEVEQFSNDHLKLLVLTARLVCVLRLLRKQSTSEDDA
jgi:hypothetical protein